MSSTLRNIVFLIFLSFSSTAFAQGRGFVEVIDTAAFRILYKYTFQKDTIKNTMADDRMVLLVGKSKSAFYSEYLFYRDSLYHCTDFMKKNLRMYTPEVDSYIYKNLKDKTLQHIDVIAYQQCYYEEEQPKFNWIIKSDTATILGVQCHKAECDSRGRHYISWFAPDIPIYNGPWKFEGLPGLIVEIWDSQNHHHFRAESIERIDEPLLRIHHAQDKYVVFDRSSFLKQYAKYIVNKIKYSDLYYGGNNDIPYGKDLQFRPIELE